MRNAYKSDHRTGRPVENLRANINGTGTCLTGDRSGIVLHSSALLNNLQLTDADSWP